MRKTTIAVLATMAAFTAPLSAQSEYNMRVVTVMTPSGKYIGPLCALPGGDFHSSSAGTYLKTATEGFKDQTGAASQVNSKTYAEGLKKTLQVSLDAVNANQKNAAGWYYYGRAALSLGDLKAADSAFTRLEALSPDCGSTDIKSMRQKAWVALVTPSSEFLKNQQFDSALAVLRAANTIARYYPQAYYNLGATFANMKPTQPDSAIFYFKLAETMASKDPAFASTVKDAVHNMAFIYQAMGDNANAIVEDRKLLVLDPGNDEVKRSLAASLRLTGGTAEAVQIENQLMSAGKLSSGEVAGVGVRLFNEKDYAGAADAFKKVLATDPNNHDALFNLANAYLALEDGKNLIETSQKLLAVDPLSATNVRLLANGWKFEKNQDKQIEVITMLQAMTFGVEVKRFAPSKDGAKLSGILTGSEGLNAAGTVIPPAAATLVFEFIDNSGATIATQEVAVQALAPNAKQDIAVEVTGAGITGWKYHKK